MPGLVWRNIRWRLFESVLIVLAVALGVAVTASALGILEARNAQTREFLDSPMFRTIEVMPRQNAGPVGTITPDMAAIPLGPPVKERVQLTLGDMYEIKRCCPDVKYAFVLSNIGFPVGPEPEPPPPGSGPRSEEEMRKFFEERRRNTIYVSATTPDLFGFFGLAPAWGNLFLDADVEKGSRVAVLGSALARRLFPDGNPVGREVELGTQNFTVIGVLEQVERAGERGDRRPGLRFGMLTAGPGGGPDDQAYVPITAIGGESAIRSFSSFSFGFGGMASSETVAGGAAGGNEAEPAPAGRGLPVNHITAAPADHSRIRQATRQLGGYVRDRYGEAVVARSPLEDLQRGMAEARQQTLTLVAFASAALAIASVNILNLMLARVLRRTRQVGIAASLGASRSTIFRLFLAEVLALGLIGALAGLALAPLAAKLLTPLLLPPGEVMPPDMPAPLVINLRVLGGGFGLALLASLVFGIYPAYQAARVNPADALRTD